MNFRIDRSSLDEILKAIGKVCGSSGESPEKIFWLCVEDDGSFKAIAQDGRGNYLEITPIDKVDCEQAFVVCLMYQDISSFVSTYKEAELECSINNEFVLIKGRGTGEYKFSRLLVDPPRRPKLSGTKDITLASVDLRTAIEKTEFCTSAVKAQAPMTSVILESKESQLTAIASDMFRVVRYICTCEGEQFRVFIPKLTCEKIITLPFGETARVRTTPTAFTIDSEENFYFYGVQEENGAAYRDLNYIFEDEAQVVATVALGGVKNKIAILSALRKGQKDAQVRLSVRGNNLVFESSSQRSQSRDSIVCKNVDNDDDVVVATLCPISHIVNGLKYAESEQIQICYITESDDDTNETFYSLKIEDNAWSYLILPMVDNQAEETQAEETTQEEPTDDDIEDDFFGTG